MVTGPTSIFNFVPTLTFKLMVSSENGRIGEVASNLVLRLCAVEPRKHCRSSDPLATILYRANELEQVTAQDTFSWSSNLLSQRKQVVILAFRLPKDGKPCTPAQFSVNEQHRPPIAIQKWMAKREQTHHSPGRACIVLASWPRRNPSLTASAAENGCEK